MHMFEQLLCEHGQALCSAHTPVAIESQARRLASLVEVSKEAFSQEGQTDPCMHVQCLPESVKHDSQMWLSSCSALDQTMHPEAVDAVISKPYESGLRRHLPQLWKS